MTTGWVRWAATSLALGMVALGTAPASASAQRTPEDCRCVDADGDAITDCTCVRTPSFGTPSFTPRLEAMAPFAFAVPRPRLGINVSSDQTGALDAQGAHVETVLEDGPAWEAGIRAGDVITEIDGQSLFEPLPGDREDDFDLDRSIPVQRLLAIARELEPGDEVDVTFLRDGEERTVTLTAEDLGDRGFGIAPGFDADRLRDQLRSLNQDLPRFQWQGGDTPMVRGTPGAFYFDDRFERARPHGLELVELNPGLGRYFGSDEGALVVSVAEGSTLGLQAGDVILRIGERDATTPDRVRRILDSYAADEQIAIHIRRDGREMSIMGRSDG
ncbi:MAG: PDZ domain-containing protein [Gemmatimonadales bacterium]